MALSILSFCSDAHVFNSRISQSHTSLLRYMAGRSSEHLFQRGALRYHCTSDKLSLSCFLLSQDISRQACTIAPTERLIGSSPPQACSHGCRTGCTKGT